LQEERFIGTAPVGAPTSPVSHSPRLEAGLIRRSLGRSLRGNARRVWLGLRLGLGGGSPSRSVLYQYSKNSSRPLCRSQHSKILAVRHAEPRRSGLEFRRKSSAKNTFGVEAEFSKIKKAIELNLAYFDRKISKDLFYYFFKL